MPPRLEFKPAARRDLRSLGHELSNQILLDVAKLQQNPCPEGSYGIAGSGLRVLSTRGYRILYSPGSDVVLILRIESSRQKDERTGRLLALSKLLQRCLEPTALRVFCLDTFGEDTANDLPGSGATASELFFQAAELLYRRGFITPDLLERLLDWCPSQAGPIRQLAQEWGWTLSDPSPNPRASPAPLLASGRYRLAFGRLEGGVIRLCGPGEAGPILCFIPL